MEPADEGLVLLAGCHMPGFFLFVFENGKHRTPESPAPMLLRRFSSGGRNASAYHPRSGAEFSSAAEMAELIAANPVRKTRFPGLNGWSSCDRAGYGCARAFLSNQQTTATQSRTAGFLSNPGWSSHVSPC